MPNDGSGTADRGQAQATRWHDVRPGDSLRTLAERYYGDGRFYLDIFDANTDVLTDPFIVEVGQRLRIPHLIATSPGPVNPGTPESGTLAQADDPARAA